MTDRVTDSLPIDELEPAFTAALASGSVLVEAEPGAGKSSRVPLWALAASGSGAVWLIQPRVLPTRALARRLAAALGEEVGLRVGYQVPFERKVSAQTRLLVMTPGILLQHLLADPELAQARVIILDEIHERAVTQDVAWAFLQEASILREDLRLVLMSATPDPSLRAQVDSHLHTAGRCYPVSVAYVPGTVNRGRSEPLADHLLRALAALGDWQVQTLLVFLPGWREIENCHRALRQAWPQVQLLRLHSRVEPAEQLRALDPRLGPRVILATNIAETSLTIADVTLVIDGGLARTAEFEQGTGVSRLHTRRISRASAEQRRGRAGRVQAGHCVRLWAEGEALAPAELPEIRRTDYLPLALWVAHWGTPWQQLPWLESPGGLGMAQAGRQLARWQLVDTEGQITPRGRQVSALGTHPRIAALLLHTADYLPANPWLLLAALALHFDWQDAPETGADSWLASALEQYRRDGQWQQQTRRWCRVLQCELTPTADLPTDLDPSLLHRLAQVMPERLAHRQASGRYRLNTGISLTAVASGEWLLVLQVAARGEHHLGVGVPVSLPEEILQTLAEARTHSHWHQGRWVRTTSYYLGGRKVREERSALPVAEVPGEVVAEIQRRGLAQIHWPEAALRLMARIALATQQNLFTLPDCSVSALEATLTEWLLPFIQVDTAPDALPLEQGLSAYVGYEALAELDRRLPVQLTLPSGRRVAVDYGSEVAAILTGEEIVPKLSGKLQEFFGAASFTLPDERVALTLALLSPAQRPLALTRDLGYFWREVYPQVRRENRGRYAKHPWPEDPLAHPPTGVTKKRLSP